MVVNKYSSNHSLPKTRTRALRSSIIIWVYCFDPSPWVPSSSFCSLHHFTFRSFVISPICLQSRCTRCTCDDCKQIGEMTNDLNVKWCKEHKEDEGTQGEGSKQYTQIMILDLRALVRVLGREWLEEYLFTTI